MLFINNRSPSGWPASDEMMDFLDTLIADSPLGTEFKLMAELFGYHTFRDITARTSEELLALPGFNRRLLFEYIDYVERQGYGELIDPEE